VPISKARAVLCYLCDRKLRISGAEVARRLLRVIIPVGWVLFMVATILSISASAGRPGRTGGAVVHGTTKLESS